MIYYLYFTIGRRFIAKDESMLILQAYKNSLPYEAIAPTIMLGLWVNPVYLKK